MIQQQKQCSQIPNKSKNMKSSSQTSDFLGKNKSSNLRKHLHTAMPQKPNWQNFCCIKNKN